MNDIITRLLKHYLPLLSLVMISIIIFYFSWTGRDSITFIAQATGYISIVILSVSFIIGPLNLVLKKKNPVSTYFRRDISITGGALAVVHSATGLFVHLRGKTWQYFLIKTEHGYSVRTDHFGLANYTGLIAAIIIILLLVTSNDYMLKKLGQVRWKNIQRYAYLMFVLSIVHSLFYRVGKADINPIFFLYIPLFVIVLIFQIIGLKLKWSGLRREP